MKNSRDISELNPETAALCREFVAECAKHRIEVLITSTYRDFESQNALYAQGRTTPGRIVTNAKGGYSWHNFRCAFDFCPIVHGKAQWNDRALFRRCGEIGKALGLEWAGDWVKFKEYAHLQHTGGATLAEMRQARAA